MSKPRAASAPAAHGDPGARQHRAPRNRVRRIAATLAALALGAGLAVAGVAAPASAHHNTISGTGVCDPQSGTFDITWTVVNSEARTETVTSSSNSSVVPVGTQFGKKESRDFAQNGVAAGTYSLKLTTKWSNGVTSTDRGSVTVDGACDEGTVKKITFCHATSSEKNPYERITTSVNAFVKAGHLDHEGDIHPGFSYWNNKSELVEVAAKGDQSLLEFADCTAPDPDVPGTLPVPAKPDMIDVCGVDGDGVSIPASTEELTWRLVGDPASGSATVVAAASAGLVFDDGTTVQEFGYEFDGTECREPSLEGSVVVGECLANAPWIVFDVVLDDPDEQATGNTAFLVLTDGANTEKIELGQLQDGVLAGRVLWPGASVADDGVTPTGWPGWMQVGGKWVMTDDNFGWTRNLTSAAIEVNPELTVDLSYPLATPECFVSPAADSGPTPDSAPAAPAAGLADTGFEGTTIAIVAGVIVVAGIALLVITRIRRSRR